jgi:non-specific serine/threonine protein kinase
VCRGTVEERIAAMMNEKTMLAENILGNTGEEKLLTEMNNDELIKFVSLDIEKALAVQT